MRVLIILAALASMMTAGSAFAQTATDGADGAGGAERRLELAGRYLELTQGSNLRKSMQALYQDIFSKSELPADQREFFIQIMSAGMEQVTEATFRDVRDDIAELFSEDELESAIVYLETPLGRAFTEKSIRLGVLIQQAMAPHLADMLTKTMTKYCARFECNEDGLPAKMS